ncbi:SpoIIE family protein phosphatase [Actinacidiphila bryophytorum]|uniref:SpoIIE family protein phosphatase n=1 Tax=Actinacidiphila bryophytorum TaxID=1436133 RepID=UPI0021769D55|nr:SpoIIE family protein phosphatase [Actinacidiphila bryophytorum]UWE11393.1 SpoIIE family protein phosphatase [Actinacidiphila bryophytorum]
MYANIEDGGDGRPRSTKSSAWDVPEQLAVAAWLSGLMEDSPEPIIILDGDDRVVWANTAGSVLAERRGIAPTGLVPWEAIPELADRGLADLVARARSTAGTSDAAKVRAVETHGWITLHWSDVTVQTKSELAAVGRSRGLEALNTSLIRAVDTEDVVAAIVEHALPMLGADGLIMHDLTGPEPRLIGLTGHGASFVEALDDMDWGPRMQGAALDASEPLFIPSAEAIAEGWPRLLPLVRAGGKKAWAVMPLMVAGEEFGVAIFTWGEPRQFTADDRSLLGTVGVVAAHALRAASALEKARHRADRLERELLPGPLPELPGIKAAVRYRTNGPGVGGHWYDVIPLPGGRVMLVVGEVSASPDDAVAMGILRQLVLTMAALDMPPDDVLAHVGDVAVRLGRRLGGGAVTATCLLAVHDPTTGRCTVVSAGHVPPVLVCPGQPPAPLEMPVGDPVGVAQVPAQAIDLDLPAGAVVVLAGGAASDAAGSPGRLVDAIARRLELTPAPAPEGAEGEWLEGLCDAVLPPGHEDLVLLALAAGRLPAAHIGEWVLPRVPGSARTSREHVADMLADWGRTGLADTVELVASELVGNTVRHARGIGVDAADPSPGTIRLRMLNLGDTVVCEVYDGSKSVPQVRHPALTDEFGRGLQLVALSADGWGTRYTGFGKCVWVTTSMPAS